MESFATVINTFVTTALRFRCLWGKLIFVIIAEAVSQRSFDRNVLQKSQRNTRQSSLSVQLQAAATAESTSWWLLLNAQLKQAKKINNGSLTNPTPKKINVRLTKYNKSLWTLSILKT